MVLGVQPVARLAPVAVERQRLSVERVRDEERDDLLRVLVRPVGVRAAGDRGVDAVGPDGRDHLQVAAGLRCRVRARRPERVVLVRRPPRRDVPVDLVRRHLHEAGAVRSGPVEQHVGAEHIRLDELRGAEDRAVYVRLGGEVEDRVGAARGSRDRLGVADVALDQLDVGAVEVRRIAGIGQLVEHDDVLAGRREALRAVGADEAGAAGDENSHGRKPRAGAFGIRERKAAAAARDACGETGALSAPFRHFARDSPEVRETSRSRHFVGDSPEVRETLRSREPIETFAQAFAPMRQARRLRLLAPQDRVRGARGGAAEALGRRRHDPALEPRLLEDR